MYTPQKKLFINLIFVSAYLAQSSFLQAYNKGVVYNLTGDTTELSYLFDNGTEIVCQKKINADPVCYHIDANRRLTIAEPTYWERLKTSFYDEQVKAEKEFDKLKQEFRKVKNRIESDFN